MIYEKAPMKDFNLIPKEELFVDNAKEATKLFLKNNCIFISSKYFIENNKFKEILDKMGYNYIMTSSNNFNRYTTGEFLDFDKDPTIENDKNQFDMTLEDFKKKLSELVPERLFGKFNDYVVPVNDKNMTSSKYLNKLHSYIKEKEKDKLSFVSINEHKCKLYNINVTAVVKYSDNSKRLDGLYYGIAFLNSPFDDIDLKLLKNSYIDSNFNLYMDKSQLNKNIIKDDHIIAVFSYNENNEVVNYTIFGCTEFKPLFESNYIDSKIKISLNFYKPRLYKDDELKRNIQARLKLENENQDFVMNTYNEKEIRINYKNHSTIWSIATIRFRKSNNKEFKGSYVPVIYTNFKNIHMAGINSRDTNNLYILIDFISDYIKTMHKFNNTNNEFNIKTMGNIKYASKTIFNECINTLRIEKDSSTTFVVTKINM